MTDIYDLSFPQSFFENEVREGFFVSGMMKRYWACELLIVSEIAKVCRRHEIPWYCVCGTLLGMVRHGGFIPWDDDLDIVMRRDDLQRFLTVAQGEMPEGFLVYDVQTQPYYRNSIAHVTNTDVIRTDNLYRFCGCPYGAGVDVFALDGIYKDPEKEADRRRRFERLKGAEILVMDGEQDTPQGKELIRSIEREAGRTFRRDKDMQGDILAQIVRTFREVALDDKEQGNFGKCEMFSQLHDQLIFETSWFDETVWMPFEHIYLPAPACYQEVIRVNYGNFMHVSKGGGAHGYPAYESQEEILSAHLSGLHPFRYTFQKEHLLQKQSQAHADRTETVRKAQELLTQVYSQADALKRTGMDAAAKQLLDGAKKLEEVVKKKVVFVVIRADWWQYLDGIYHTCCEDTQTEVKVVCVPWYERNPDLSTGARHEETADFPKEIHAIPAEQTDLASLQPDEIYIQFPYDGEDQAMTIDAAFFSSALSAMTPRLIYVPPYPVCGKDVESETARKAMRTLIEQPAVVYADEILLPDEGMCRLYTDVMTEIAGGDTAIVWNNKIKVMTGRDVSSDLFCPGQTVPQDR